MLKDFLSEETFRKGIIHYLKKFTYRNAKNDDLWHSLSNVSHRLSYRRLLVSLNSEKLIMKAYKEPGRLQSMGSKESDTTEWLHFDISLSCIGEGNGNPLQCSYLENSRNRGAWWAAVYGVAQTRTWLKRLSSSSSSINRYIVRQQMFIALATLPGLSR